MFSNEEELVLRCARVGLDDDSAGEIARVLGRPLDWERILRLASQHGVLPLVDRHLNSHFSADVPVGPREQLSAHAQRSARESLFLTTELVKITAALETEGIPSVPYKGPTLAARTYGSLTLRPFSDLDLLVRPMDAARAADVLVRSGLFASSYAAPESAGMKYDQSYYQTFRQEGRGPVPVQVELHWNLPTTFELDINRCWGRLDHLTLLGVRVRQFAPDDLLLLLCAHGFKHFWNLVKWICDVAELISRRDTLDWDRLVHECRDGGAARVVGLGLALAQDLLSADVPAAGRRLATDRVVQSFVPAVRERLFSDRRRPVGLVKNWRIRERWSDRAAYVSTLITYAVRPEIRDRAELVLPRALSFLHYPLRPARVAVRLAQKYASRQQ